MAMRKPLTLLLFSLLSCAAVASAASALYDFGTMQEGKVFSAQPGDTVNISLYFFVDEEYGNRITHIRVSPEIVPEGWEVTFDPPMHKEYLNISGIITTSNENLYIEPRPVLAQKPETPEKGTYYLLSPSGKGYLQAKRVLVSVKVPASAQLGQSFDLKLGAESFWFGQTGNIALQQTRSFSYSINTAQKEYSEQVVTAEQLAAKEAVATRQPVADNTLHNTLLYIIGGVAVVLLAYLVFLRKRGAAPSQ